jgi:GDPmannose 4,6-dehydratase
MKKALITGIGGQDGWYLADFLYQKGYEVHGTVRHAPPLPEDYVCHLVDLSDAWSLQQVIAKIKPDEIYNLAAMSNERFSFDRAEYTAQVNGLAVMQLLEIVRQHSPSSKVFQAASSELFGKVACAPQNEQTPFHPRSLYGTAKLFAHWSVVNYREAYQLYACNGILFNHESPRRGSLFVTKKIIASVVRIERGLQEKLVLGNLDTQRDWGYAKDFVEAMWLMLQQETPSDFVLATGRLATVRQFVEISFASVGMTICWIGSGLEEKGIDQKTGRVCVEVAAQFFRQSEEIPLVGDATKAKEKLNWAPMTTLEELIHIMVEHEKAVL